MNYDFIVDHALKNVWGSPPQDSQVILEPARLTPRHGRHKQVRVMWSEYLLPDQINRWHVYQIGGIHPLAFKLLTRCNQWTSLQEACNTTTMIANVYGDNGFEFPLFDTYYRYTESGNIILAVKINAKISVALNDRPLFLRVYTNAFFQSSRSSSITPPDVQVTGKVIENAGDKTTLGNLYAGYSARPGKAIVKINGTYHSTFDPAKMVVGDFVEIVYDASVYKVVRFLIGDLPVFESTLDSKRKYLLHYADPLARIDFHDDIDVFITQKQSDNTYKGVYYHKNGVDAMRNVTHKDYSIETTYVKRATESIEGFQPPPKVTLEPNTMYVELFIRNAGWDRPLTFENNRIHELYKMSDENVKKAFTGIDATVPYWTPPVLEASMYAAIMRYNCSQITNQVVEDGYGYNAISKYLGDTPTVVTDNGTNKTVPVPYRMQFGATAYEYDEDGVLIDWHQHLVGRTYVAHSNDCHYVEFIGGLGGEVLDEVYNARITPFKDKHSYRVYLSQAVANISNNKWVDVTGDTTKYRITDGLFVWMGTGATDYPLLRSDARFLARDFELHMQEGALTFDIVHLQSRNNQIANWKMQIPLGQMDLFVNGKSLIRGLDYFVDFPKVHIVSKKHLNYPLTEPQKVHLRFTGHCTAEQQMLPEGDIGFIEHGVMSNNSRFDIRDDKVLRIIVNGELKTRDELVFSEFHSGVGVLDPLNGSPYMVKDILVPVRQHTTSDTATLWNKAKVIDKVVSDYLTKKIPQPPRPAPSALVDRYQLFSPFCNKLILDLKYERFRIPQKPGGFTRQEVIEMCVPYEYLLKFDPTQEMNEQDDRCVVIHPHGLTNPIGLRQNEYQFMYQVVQYYCRNRLTLSPSVVVL